MEVIGRQDRKTALRERIAPKHAGLVIICVSSRKKADMGVARQVSHDCKFKISKAVDFNL